jgi:magnesium transporter
VGSRPPSPSVFDRRAAAQVRSPRCGTGSIAALRHTERVTAEVRTRLWLNGELLKENFPLADVSDYLGQPNHLVWIDVCHPEQEHLTQIAEEIGLDPHYIEDAVEPRERPKASRFNTHMFVTTTAIAQDKATGELVGQRISAFTIGGGFVTIRPDDSFDMSPVLQRWDENKRLMTHGPRALLYGLLDVIVDGYFEAVETLDDAIEEAEDLLFDQRRTQAESLQRHTFALRKSLVRSRRVILPMREVVNTVMHRFTEEDDRTAELVPYFEDLYDHVLRASEWTESLRDMVSTIFETNMALSDNRMNSVMKQLTAWAAIIAVPTAITGFYGQNVPYPGFGRVWGVITSVSLIVAIAGGLWLSFRRRDWL